MTEEKDIRSLEEKIMYEITEHCETCPIHEKCTEEECVLYRIEKIVEREKDYE